MAGIFNPDALGKILSIPDNTHIVIAREGKGIPERASLEVFSSFLPVEWVVDLMLAVTTDIYAPYDLSIETVTDIKNSPTTTLLVNGGAYVLGTGIVLGDKITVTVSTNAVVNLSIKRIN